MSSSLRPAIEAWLRGPKPILPVSPGWPRGLELAAVGMLGLVAAAAWLPGMRGYFHLRPAVPLATLALACAYGFGVNAADARRPFSPPTLLASAIVYGALVQLFAWSLVLWSDDPGALALANGPILIAASHALRLRPTPRFPWPLAGHALGTGAAFLVAPPERVSVVLVAGPLMLAAALLVGFYAERLRRASGLIAQHADAIHARELEARAAELSGLSASLLELMQRGHDSRSALSGALLDAEQLECAAQRTQGGDGAALRAAAASLRATLERLRQLVDTRRGLLSSSAPHAAADPAVRVMPAVLFAVAAARLRTSSARLAAHAMPGAKGARARVAGGEESLSRMLEILLENGWQGNGVQGGSRVDVEVSAEERTGALAIAVRDDGPGFSPELLARPIAPFVTTKPGGARARPLHRRTSRPRERGLAPARERAGRRRRRHALPPARAARGASRRGRRRNRASGVDVARDLDPSGAQPRSAASRSGADLDLLVAGVGELVRRGRTARGAAPCRRASRSRSQARSRVLVRRLRPSTATAQSTSASPSVGCGTPTAKREREARVALERLLDLDRRDVRAAGLDQVREAAGPVQMAVGVERAAVLRVEVAVGVEDLLGRDLVVAAHQRRRPSPRSRRGSPSGSGAPVTGSTMRSCHARERAAAAARRSSRRRVARGAPLRS